VVALETVRLTATLVLPPSPQKVTLQLYDPGVRLVGLSVAVAANGVLPPLTLSHGQPEPGVAVTTTPMPGFALPIETLWLADAVPPTDRQSSRNSE
jgi:hypothetical protein